jgi:hypothetical protein
MKVFAWTAPGIAELVITRHPHTLTTGAHGAIPQGLDFPRVFAGLLELPFDRPKSQPP